MKLPDGMYIPDPPRRPSGIRVAILLLLIGTAAIPIVYGATILLVEIDAVVRP